MLGNSEANSYEEEALGQIPSNLFFGSSHLHIELKTKIYRRTQVRS